MCTSYDWTTYRSRCCRPTIRRRIRRGRRTTSRPDPQADPAGAAYDVEAGDLGLHLLIAPGERRAGFTGQLLGALAEFIFGHLGHPRLVVEPDIRNTRAIDRFHRTGFILGRAAKITHPDGTTKTAQFAFLTREAFYG